MRDLVSGERAPVGGRLVLTLADPLRPPLGLALIALDRGRTASAAFPPIDSTTREMRPAAQFEEGGRVAIDLDQMPAGVERLVSRDLDFRKVPPGGRTAKPVSLVAGE